jgi:hypothetical protein
MGHGGWVVVVLLVVFVVLLGFQKMPGGPV